MEAVNKVILGRIRPVSATCSRATFSIALVSIWQYVGYVTQTVYPDVLCTKARTVSRLDPILVSRHISRMVDL